MAIVDHCRSQFPAIKTRLRFCALFPSLLGKLIVTALTGLESVLQIVHFTSSPSVVYELTIKRRNITNCQSIVGIVFLTADKDFTYCAGSSLTGYPIALNVLPQKCEAERASIAISVPDSNCRTISWNVRFFYYPDRVHVILLPD